MSKDKYAAIGSWRWWRAYHGLPFDPKLAVVTKRCGARRGDVAAVWVSVLDYASQREERGSVEGIDAEEIAVSFDYETEYVMQIIAAFEEKGMIRDGRVAAWERRQVQRERNDDSAGRVRAYRQRQKQASVTPCNATETTETPSNAPEERREEESREEEKNLCASPAGDARVSVAASEPTKKPARLTESLTPQQDLWFAEVWGIYWRRVAKKPARKAFGKAITTPEMFGRVLAAIRSQTPEMLAREAAHRPHFATWLNQERWGDEAAEPPKSKSDLERDELRNLLGR